MKYLGIGIVLVALYAGSLLWKNQVNEIKNSEYLPTTYELQKKNGIPDFVTEVKRDKFQHFITITGIFQNGLLKSAVAPMVRNQIKTGSRAKLELDNGERFVMGRVTSVSSGPNLLTGLYEVTVTFDGNIPKGLGAVTVDIPVKEVNNVLVVPRESVNIRGEKPALFVLENNKLTKKVVEIAGSNADVFWIKSGVKQNETIVVSDTRYFVGGEFVKVMTEAGNEL
jgi:multidrug efflux pump subunit AcrA (membrane-fusion protein)